MKDATMKDQQRIGRVGDAVVGSVHECQRHAKNPLTANFIR